MDGTVFSNDMWGETVFLLLNDRMLLSLLHLLWCLFWFGFSSSLHFLKKNRWRVGSIFNSISIRSPRLLCSRTRHQDVIIHGVFSSILTVLNFVSMRSHHDGGNSQRPQLSNDDRTTQSHRLIYKLINQLQLK